MDNKIETKEGKRKFALWIRESALEKVRQWYDGDNCASQSEFIEKAVLFYVGYLASNNAGDYMPKIIISTLKGIVNESDNRISRILFKLAVEAAMLSNLEAIQVQVSDTQMQQLRKTCSRFVAENNGIIKFEEAYEYQHR